ncbi:MAG TPA: hypothetical protein VNT79_11750, partial [Phycisphaerae bacterium]|nr:hypothetical protein [Phycisphaerae bacterium]
MNKLKQENPAALSPNSERLRHVALIVLLALIPLRSLIPETHTFEMPRLLRNLSAPAGPQPATTFAIAAVIVAVAAWVLFDSFKRRRGLHATGAEIGAALLLAAAVISTFRAGQK